MTALVTAGEIRRYCAAKGIAHSTFGRATVNDPALVSDMLAGREVRPSTSERIRDYIANGVVPVDRRRIAD